MSFDHRGETILIHNGLDGRPWLDIARPVLFAAGNQLSGQAEQNRNGPS